MNRELKFALSVVATLALAPVAIRPPTARWSVSR